MLKLRDIMTPNVVTIAPDATLREAMETLATRHVSGAPVVAGEQVVGVLSAIDLLDFAASLPGVPTDRSETLSAIDEIEESVPTWDEDTEPPASFFTEMWDDAGSEVQERIAETAGPEWNVLEEHTVREAMSPLVIALPPDALAANAARLMRQHRIHRVLVMEQARLEGIVTATDISNAVADGRLTARRYVFPPLVAPRRGARGKGA